jgi:hypothetical protein
VSSQYFYPMSCTIHITSEKRWDKTLMGGLFGIKKQCVGYRTTGIASTSIVQAPSLKTRFYQLLSMFYFFSRKICRLCRRVNLGKVPNGLQLSI